MQLPLSGLVRRVLLLEGETDASYVQTASGKRVIKYDGITGITSLASNLSETQRTTFRNLLNLRPVDDLVKYDDDILAACSAQKINPALFKALALMESQLGKQMTTGGGGSARGFIHMTQSTYLPYAGNVGVKAADMDALMLDPKRSIPVCAMHLKYLIDKFKTPEAVAFSVKNGEYKISKIKSGPDGSRKASTEISNSDYTQITLALRALFNKDGAFPVGKDL